MIKWDGKEVFCIDNLILIIIAGVTSILAAVSPIVTSIIQKKTAVKVKNLELVYDTKIKFFQKFAEGFGYLNDEYKPEDCALFYASAYQVMLICSDKTRTEIQKFICYMKESIATFYYKQNPKEFRIHLHARFEECSELIHLDLQQESFKPKRGSKTHRR